MNVAIFDLATGNVVSSVSVSPDAWQPEHDIEDGQGFLWVSEDTDLAGKRVVGGQLVDAPVPLPDMPRLLLTAETKIDRLAGRERQRHITDVPGQQLVYAEKAREARAWIAAGKPDTPGEYPNIAGSALGSGTAFADEAAAVTAQAAAWAQISSGIERRRTAAKTAARAATTPTAIAAAIDLYSQED